MNGLQFLDGPKRRFQYTIRRSLNNSRLRDHTMNPFVNFNKRGIELPKGCTDLADVLQAQKCEYCDDIAVATKGWPGDYRWCEACQRDLREFASKEDYEAACSLKGEVAMSLYRADLQRRQDKFMRDRVKERSRRDSA
jgi:hypothetical protein